MKKSLILVTLSLMLFIGVIQIRGQTTYPVSFDANVDLTTYDEYFFLHVVGYPSTEVYPISVNAEEGTEFYLQAPSELGGDYTFQHWYDNDAGIIYTDSTSIEVAYLDRSYNLTAVYEPAEEFHVYMDASIPLDYYDSGFTISYEFYPTVEGYPIDIHLPGGVTGVVTAPSTVTVEFGEEAVFQHWYDNDAGEIYTTENTLEIISLDRDYNLTAIYEAPTTYDIKLNANVDFELYGRNITIQPEGMPTLAQPLIDMPIPEGISATVIAPIQFDIAIGTLEFVHWWDNATDEIYSATNQIEFDPVDTDVNLTAIYEGEGLHIVNFDSNIDLNQYPQNMHMRVNGQTTTRYPIKRAVPENWEVEVTVPLLVHSGRYIFQDWYDNDSGEIYTTSTTVNIQSIARDYDLTARYEEITQDYHDLSEGLIDALDFEVTYGQAFGYTPMPRFKYYSRESGSPQNNMVVWFNREVATEDDAWFSLEYFDNDGRVIRRITVPTHVDEGGLLTHTHRLDTLPSVALDGVGYRVLYGGVILFSGYLAPPPGDDFYDTLAINAETIRGGNVKIQLGDYVYNESTADGYLYDPHHPKFVDRGSPLLMHYEISGNVANSLEDYQVQIINESTGDIHSTIPLTVIWEQGAFDNGNLDERAYRGYIPMTTGAERFEYVDYLRYHSSEVLTLNFESGVYSAIVMHNGEQVAISEPVIIRGTEEDVWSFTSNREEYTVNSYVNWTFRYTNEDIFQTYNSVQLFETMREENRYVIEPGAAYRSEVLLRTQIESLDPIDLDVYDYLGDRHGGYVRIESEEWHSGLSSDYGYYELRRLVHITEEVERPPLGERLDNWLVRWNLYDTEGQMFLTGVMILIVNLILVLVSGPALAYALVNLVLIGIFSFLGWMPAWMTIGLGILSVGILIKGER